MVSQPCQRPIPPGSAHRKVKKKDRHATTVTMATAITTVTSSQLQCEPAAWFPCRTSTVYSWTSSSADSQRSDDLQMLPASTDIQVTFSLTRCLNSYLFSHFKMASCKKRVKKRRVLREIHLRTTGRHLSTGSHECGALHSDLFVRCLSPWKYVCHGLHYLRRNRTYVPFQYVTSQLSLSSLRGSINCPVGVKAGQSPLSGGR